MPKLTIFQSNYSNVIGCPVSTVKITINGKNYYKIYFCKPTVAIDKTFSFIRGMCSVTSPYHSTLF